MIYPSVRMGRFVSRPNRFIAQVDMQGELHTVHVKNTGRCRELLVPGAQVYLAEGTNPARKTRYDLIAVRKGDWLINMDSQAPNHLFGEAAPRLFEKLTLLRPETVYEDSRFDFYLEADGRPAFVEVKGVTLEEDGHARFPDAPTLRGIKHLEGLCRAAEAGYDACVCFVIQMKGVHAFSPNDRTHPQFGQALRKAQACGVKLMAYDCRVTPDTVWLDEPVPIIL